MRGPPVHLNINVLLPNLAGEDVMQFLVDTVDVNGAAVVKSRFS